MVGTVFEMYGDLCLGTQGRMCASLRCSYVVGFAPQISAFVKREGIHVSSGFSLRSEGQNQN